MTEHSTMSGAKGLFSDVLTHATNLIRGEVDLARAEISENLKAAATAVGLIVGGVVIALTSLNVLAAALVAALTDAGMASGWAALLVGVGFALIAFALTYKGLNDLKPASIAPTRAGRNLRRDVDAVKESYHDK
ncbi:putative superfamily III holin-X [Hoeflea halophila]|uniref:Putative superfamily III holin-X n=1 Tax=Hoeflea halophila TaxID=714899 RepID=A0A286HL88_9HYPH|nr:phage holin family protein [Hoeflea halophila]SOE08532.1 putative superfamily III holin-X [Hoeflea halophila]